MHKKSKYKAVGFKVALAVCAVSVAGVLTVSADSIISMNLSNDTRAEIGAAVEAGAVRAVNWNTILNGGPALTNALYETGSAATGVTITPNNFAYSNRGNNPAAGDDQLFNGVKDVTGTFEIAVTGLSFAEYDVYVYQRGESEVRGGGFMIGSTTYYARGIAANPTDATGYVLSTDTDISGGPVVDQMDQGNYVKFSGLTGSDFTLSVQAYGDDITRSKVAGLQIVAVPEPGTLGLIGAFGCGLLFIRRRFKK